MSAGNEPAYPVKRDKDIDTFVHDGHFGGLTKRELIAAMAMQGCLSYSHASQPSFHSVQESVDYYAKLSIAYADALLAALAEAKPSQEVGRG